MKNLEVFWIAAIVATVIYGTAWRGYMWGLSDGRKAQDNFWSPKMEECGEAILAAGAASRSVPHVGPLRRTEARALLCMTLGQPANCPLPAEMERIIAERPE